ncbi:MAG TPA: carboxypeptidase regulatory-like domain-containing protein [Terriglobia bacterium]|nr:carboxypeptidase regulatory-like domain-containing protein [Terriglobia bacterium]
MLCSKQALVLFATVVLLVSAIWLPVRVTGQVSGGAVSGTVTDAAGAAMPKVRVSIRNVATGAIAVVTTDARGFYTVPDLTPDTYEMTASTQGFVTQVRTGIAVTVGAKLVLNLTMQPGSPQKVVRTAAVVESQSSSASGGNVNSATVRNTPLNGRDWTQLATLQSGVTGIQTGSGAGATSAQRGFGTPLSVSGARPDENNYLLDGISINDYSNGAPGSVLGANLGVDAIQQFSVLGSNYPAQYGRTSGGIINAVTRSGTNAFHGDVYEFLRNSSLDARNFFDINIPPFRRNQFGGSAGGPIQKGRFFFFADYEGLRQSLGVTQVDTMPSAAARTGQLSTGTVTVDPTVARYLTAFYPLPNGPLLGAGDTGIFTFAGQQVTTENYFTTRIDRKISDKDSVYGTYMHDNSEFIQPDSFDNLLSNVVSRRQVVTLHEAHTFSPNFLNVARFGFNRAIAIQGGLTKVINPLVADPSFGFIPGQFVGAISNVPGLTGFPAGASALLPGKLNTSQTYTWNSFQAGDDAFLTKGVHALQFGANVERMQYNQLQASQTDGTFRFSSLSNFLTNHPQNFTGLVPNPLPVFGSRETLFGVYVQDDIRVRRNLTLNAGLRYEMTTVPAEVHNRLSNLHSPTDAQPNIGSPYFLNPTLRNFEPRLGFAWSPGGSSKTLFRGGFGVFDVLPLPYQFTLAYPIAAPFYKTLTIDVLPPGSFPTGAFQQAVSNPASAHAAYVEYAPKRNYVMQWNLSVAQELSPSLAATLGYVGSRGVHMPYRMDNIDMVLPTLTSSGYLFPPTTTSQTLNPNYGRISGNLWQGNSFYDALEANLTERISHGVSFHAAYTWGRNIDTLSATAADDNYPNGIFNPLFFDQRTTRGLSDFNVSQNFVLNFTWQMPSSRSRSRFARWTIDGWQLGGVYRASSGQPFTPILGGDPLGTKLDQTSEPPNRLVGPDCGSLTNPGNPNQYIKTQCLAFPAPANLLGNLGRNALIGPGLSNLDFSLIKNTPIRMISENFNLQFRAEFFNILNRANFASPTDNLTVFDQSGSPVSGAGLITFTQTPSREIQFALKLIW